MSDVTLLHRQSMAKYEAALLIRESASKDRARLLHEAFELEKCAAQLMREKRDEEPSRSVLYRSAATLAMSAHEFRAAEQLASEGLAGNCPEELATEFRQIIKQAAYEQTLAEDGVKLLSESLRVAFDGSAVGFGLIRTDVFQQKLNSILRLVKRTYERIAGLPFEDSIGRPSKHQAVTQYVSAPMAGSFAIDVRLGSVEAPELPVFSMADKALAELVSCFELIQSGDAERLKDRIADEHYYANFLALARDILPDGERITIVRLDANLISGRRSVSVTRARNSVELHSMRSDRLVEVRVEGVLKFANDIGGRHEVALEGERGKRVATVVVPPEMMEDIVRPRWGQPVVILGLAKLNTKGQPKHRPKDKIEFQSFVDD